MSFDQRKLSILKILNLQKTVSAVELMKSLNASAATIRRDLTDLEKEGHIARTHGGAMLPELKMELPVTTYQGQKHKNTFEKNYIAKIASNMLENGDTVFLGSGTTVETICQYILDLELYIVTNSWPIIYAMAHSKSKIKVIGGDFDVKIQANVGQDSVRQLAHYQCKKSILGMDGIHFEMGLSSYHEQNAILLGTILKNSQENIVLADHTKINKNAFVHIGPAILSNKLITDTKTPFDQITLFRKQGIKIYQ